MKVTVRQVSKYKHVNIEHDSIAIELGLLGDVELRALARNLMNGIYAIAPSYKESEWIKDVIKDCGIDIN